MKLVFFGTPLFAATVLKGLLEHRYTPLAVICNPDRPVGRKKILTAPAAKQLALHNAIPVFQPENIHALESCRILREEFDYGIVAAYARIIPHDILQRARHGFIGVHPSLLPRYRGASPIQSSLLAGDTITGVTLYRMDEKVDHGPILAQVPMSIASRETTEILSQKLAVLAGSMLGKTLPLLQKESVIPMPQADGDATFTKKFTSEDGFVSEASLISARTGNREDALAIERKIRALGHEPGVWTVAPSLWGNKRVKLLEAEITTNGGLQINLIHIEGKTPSKPRF